MAVGRPVRLTLTRTEDFLTTTPTPASEFVVRLGARRDGTIRDAIVMPIPTSAATRSAALERQELPLCASATVTSTTASSASTTGAVGMVARRP